MTTSSITYWNRLEPRPRAVDLSEALAARAYDPAWLLARQWQLGEFQGEDAGAPAYVRVSTRTAPLTAWGELGGAARPLHPAAPLEASLTAEPPSPDDLARAVEIGQTFERLLADAGAAHLRPLFVAAYPVPDTAERRPAGGAAARVVARAGDRRPGAVGRDPAAGAAAAARRRPDAGTGPGRAVDGRRGVARPGRRGGREPHRVDRASSLGGPGEGAPPGWRTETLSAAPVGVQRGLRARPRSRSRPTRTGAATSTGSRSIVALGPRRRGSRPARR
jgi:hypothetical protein